MERGSGVDPRQARGQVAAGVAPRGEIWLADALRALHVLGGSDAARRRAVLRALGLVSSAVRAPQADADPPTTVPPAVASAPATGGSGGDRPPSNATTPGPRARPVTGAARRSRRPAGGPPLPESGRQVVAYESALPAMGELVPLARSGAGSGRTRPPFTPLLTPSTARSVLQLLLAQSAPTGPVDVRELVRATAAQRLRTVPRERVRALPQSVQVLVDRGDGMELFSRDQADVVQRLDRLVGSDRLDVRYFADAPLRGCGPSGVWTWTRYSLPPLHSTVLLLSDLGLGTGRLSSASAGRAEWEEFAAVLSWQSRRVVALVPLSARRLPHWARRLFSTVTWDRSLTVPRAGTTTS